MAYLTMFCNKAVQSMWFYSTYYFSMNLICITLYYARPGFVQQFEKPLLEMMEKLAENWVVTKKSLTQLLFYTPRKSDLPSIHSFSKIFDFKYLISAKMKKKQNRINVFQLLNLFDFIEKKYRRENLGCNIYKTGT